MPETPSLCDGSWFELRPVPDDPEILHSFVTAAEWETAAAMTSLARRTEWLAWRAAARERLGHDTTITYDANGAPVLEKGRGYISVSHTKGWIAVMWSPQRCAADIEHASRDVSRTAARFVSEEERLLSDAANPLFPISVWCAKEALFKYSSIPGLDFRDDLHITSSDIAAGLMTGTVRDGDPITINISFTYGLVIATIR